MRFGSAIAFALMLTPCAASAEVVKGDVVGDWHIFSSTDSMKDGINCAAFYQDNPHIALKNSSLEFSYRGRGGLDGYYIRFDEKKPEGPFTVRTVRSILLMNSEFKKVLASQRVRVKAFTLLRGVVEDDVDLSGIAPAIAKMQEMGCNP